MADRNIPSKNDVDRLVAQRGLLMRALTLCIAWADHSVIKHRTAKDRDPAHAAVIKDLGDWAASINEQVDELRASLPAECSGNPASCPENEGRGCACSPRETKAEPEFVSVGWQYKFPSIWGGHVWRDSPSRHNGSDYTESREVFARKRPDCPHKTDAPKDAPPDPDCTWCQSAVKSRGDSPPPIVMTASTPDELYGVDTGMSISKAPQT